MSFSEQIFAALEEIRTQRPVETPAASPIETAVTETVQDEPISVRSVENVRRELEANGISASSVTLTYDEVTVRSPFGDWINRGVTVDCANGRSVRFCADAAARDAWAIGQASAAMAQGRGGLGLPVEDTVA